jgi:hypothetical protein
MSPTLQQFKAWARSHYDMAHTVCMAQAFAQLERERVNAYIKPVFDLFDFYVNLEWRKGEPGKGVRQDWKIIDPDKLYLSDQGDLCAEYYAECDREHRKHGFDGPQGHCPALRAEELQRQAEYALLLAASDLFGADLHETYGDQRRKALDLLLGACLKREVA